MPHLHSQRILRVSICFVLRFFFLSARAQDPFLSSATQFCSYVIYFLHSGQLEFMWVHALSVQKKKLLCQRVPGHSPYLILTVKYLEFLIMFATENCIWIHMPHKLNFSCLLFTFEPQISYLYENKVMLIYVLLRIINFSFFLLDKRSAHFYSFGTGL